MHTTPGTAAMLHPSSRRPRRGRQDGFSLVESLIPLAVMAVLLGSALPSLETMKLRRQLEGSAAQLETDLQLARASAVAANQVLRMDFYSSDHGSGYVLHDGDAGDCDVAADSTPVCASGTTPWRVVLHDARQPVRLSANVRSIAFDPVKGTITPTATMRLQAPIGSLRLIINVMGRIRSCTPDGALPGQPAC
jgi:type IV fimbrial biogenesis protein FimT